MDGLGDTIVEDAETFIVAVGHNGLMLATATVRIADDDGPPGSIQVSDTSLPENSGTAVFRLTLASPASRPVSVAYATVAASAKEGVDYAPTAGTVTFAPGETLREVEVQVFADATTEADETFRLALSNPDGATLQERLAEVAGLTSVQLSRIENGANEPKLTTILRLAKALGVQPGELIDRIKMR